MSTATGRLSEKGKTEKQETAGVSFVIFFNHYTSTIKKKKCLYHKVFEYHNTIINTSHHPAKRFNSLGSGLGSAL